LQSFEIKMGEEEDEVLGEIETDGQVDPVKFSAFS
jgi:hypothetical protein